MAQAVIRKLAEDTLAAYRLSAKAKGSSLEAELRETLERHAPAKPKDSEALGRLSRELRAMTPPDGPDSSDSTLLIRWDRDTDHGRWIDDGWADRIVGR